MTRDAEYPLVVVLAICSLVGALIVGPIAEHLTDGQQLLAGAGILAAVLTFLWWTLRRR